MHPFVIKNMKLKNLSIKTKIFLIAIVGPLVVALILAWQRVEEFKASEIENIINKSKTVVFMAEATRMEMGKKLDLGVISSFEEIDPDKILEVVPVVTAMQVAAVNADKAGYAFRVPKEQPRNNKNIPTSEELAALREIKTKNLDELIVVGNDEVRYYRPVRLTRDCLFCHGDPAGKEDPTGGRLEGWHEGEIHGAFEIISSLAPIHQKISQMKMTVLLWTGGILVAIVAIVWWLLQTSIVVPLKKASHYIQQMTSGNLRGTCEICSQDEFGHIARELEQMSSNLGHIIGGIATTSGTLDDAADELGHSADIFATGAQNMSARSLSVSNAAERMSLNMNSVAAATEQASTNIALVSTAAEGISETLENIVDSTEKTKRITAKAVDQAEVSSKQIDALGEAARRIDRVTETISEISDQTSLLALNATIEAARAGEAGKGFAIVANEIKELAKQTAEATFEIQKQIEDIQNTTSNSVDEISRVSNTIKEINTIVVEVGEAVSEQNMTTREIAANISQATLGIQEVTKNVSQSSVVAQEVAHDISQVNDEATSIAESSRELTEKASRLRKLSLEQKKITKQFTL